jgi:hypothetical protein
LSAYRIRPLLSVLAVVAVGVATLTLIQPAETAREKNGPVIGGSLNGRQIFPPDNPWNQDVSLEPVDSNSDALIANIGLDTSLHPDFGTVYRGAPVGIPYVTVSGNQKPVPVRFVDYPDESDPGPYPVPKQAPIEGGPRADGDRHVVVVDRDNWVLYELFNARPVKGGRSWRASNGARFDLSSNALRPAGWTSADAAGLPILPGLVRYDEVVERGEILHALRFTCSRSRRAYVAPARHAAGSSDDPLTPPMGMRVRLKASVDVSAFPATARVVLTALQRYGMLLADNGGDWFLSGAPDARWNQAEIEALKQIHGRDFEVVQMGEVVTQ